MPHQPQFCPRCGAAYEPLQEYCLECGARLPESRGVVGVLAGAWQRRLPWYPGDWIWPALAFLAVALLATAAAVAAGSSGGSGTTIVAQPTVTLGPGRPPTAPPATAAGTIPSPRPTVTTGPLPKAPGAPSTKAATTPAPAGTLTSWPRAATGYTDVLASLPLSVGRRAAERGARTAKQAGLPQAGVLVSSAYASLHPGYYVVFSGVYRTPAAAVAGLAAARAHGFPDAYVARVTS